MSNLYQELQKLEGRSNAEIIAAQPARYVFWREANKFANDREDPDDVMQQGFLMFLQQKPMRPKSGKFSRYLVAAIRHSVIRGHRYTHTKKRYLPTVNFFYDQETQRPIEPKGEPAAILFDEAEVDQILEKIRKQVLEPERKGFVHDVLKGFLDGETQSETARRLGVTPGRVSGARITILIALNPRLARKIRATPKRQRQRRKQVTDGEIREAIRCCRTNSEAIKSLGISTSHFYKRLKSIKAA